MRRRRGGGIGRPACRQAGAQVPARKCQSAGIGRQAGLKNQWA